MVNIRLLHLMLFPLFLLIALTDIAAAKLFTPKLILFSETSESLLGRPIRIEIYGISLKTQIANIKLEALNENFGVVTGYIINTNSDKRWPNQNVQILKLKLYPRKIGKLHIPAVSLGKIKSNKIYIDVFPGETGVPTITYSTENPYARQQTIINVTITSAKSSARLIIQKDHTIENFKSSPILFKRTQLGKNNYLLKIGWVITAYKSGQHQLSLPPIEYRESGVSRKKFYLPIQNISIKALPSYLPPTIPIGKVTITSSISPNYIFKTESLSYWNIKMSGNVNSSYKLPAILRQIKSNENIKYLPVTTKRSVLASENSLTSYVHHSVPFKISKSGFTELPVLQIQYFDPLTGKIKRIKHKIKSVFTLSVFWVSITALLMIIVFIYLVKIIIARWQRFKFSKTQRNQALELLNENNDIQTIRKAIRLFAVSEFWPQNLSLNQWAQFWKNRYHTNNNFDKLIQNLSTSFYHSGIKCDTDKLRLQLLDLDRNRKTKRNLFHI